MGERELAANRAKWIAALRSGEYKQTTLALKRDGGFCCLGVACEVLGEHIGSSELYLSDEMVARVGLRDFDGADARRSRTLSSINDHGATFTEIADLLETGDFWAETGEAAS